MKTKVTIGRCTVNHWENSRMFAFTSERVGLQLSAGFCTCKTCSSRFEHFLYLLQRKEGLKYAFPHYEYSYQTMEHREVRQRSRWVVFDLPEGQNALDFLRSTLGIQIDNVLYYEHSDSYPKELVDLSIPLRHSMWG